MKSLLLIALVSLLTGPIAAEAGSLVLSAKIVSVKLDAEKKRLLVDVEHISDGSDFKQRFFVDSVCVSAVQAVDGNGRCTANMYHKSTTSGGSFPTTRVSTVVIDIEDAISSKQNFNVSKLPLTIMGRHPVTNAYSEATIVLP